MRRFLRIVLAGLVLVSGVAQAHLLNMTEMNLRVASGEASTLVIKIDLGQSLLAPEAYWESTTAPAQPAWTSAGLTPLAAPPPRRPACC